MFKNLYLLGACFLLISTSLFANTGRYRLMFNTDPATEITVGWEQISGTGQKVYFDTVDHGTNWQLYADSMTPYRSTTYMGMNNQFAILTGLTPNTPYYFVIRDSEGTSNRYWFRTCPDDGVTPLSFISGGDSRSGYTQRIKANQMVAKIRPHAVLFGGDLTNTPGDQSTQDWLDHWQQTTTSDGQMIPAVHSFGNHEALGTGGANWVRDLFDTPVGTYYKVTFGGDLFSVYTINGEVMPGRMLSDPVTRQNQLTWLTNTLPNDNATWKSAQYHHPMLPHNSSKVVGYNLFNDFADLFYDNGVRLVMESDAHVVKVSQESRPNQILAATPNNEDTWFVTDNLEVNKGITFIGEGSWGTLRTDDVGYDNTLTSGSFYQFNWVVVTPCQILVRSIDTQNPTNVPEHAAGDYFSISAGLDAQVWKPQASNNGVFEINKCATPFASFSTEDKDICLGSDVTFDNQTLNNATSYAWDFGDGDTSILAAPTHSYQTPGNYTVQLIATNTSGSDTLVLRDFVQVRQTPAMTKSNDTTICSGEAVNIFANNAAEYSWSNGLSNDSTHAVSPQDSTVYYVTGTTDGCSVLDSITVQVNQLPAMTVSNDTTICSGESANLLADGAQQYNWSEGLGAGTSHQVAPSQSTIYYVTGTNNGCNTIDSIAVTVQAFPVLTLSNDTSICEGSSTTIDVAGADDYTWNNGLGNSDSHVVQPTSSTYYNVTGTINGCSIQDSILVTVDPAIQITTTVDTSICEGDAIEIEANGANTYSWNQSLGNGSVHTVTPTTTVTYAVTGVSGSCDATDSITITVFELPEVTLNAFPVNSICISSGKVVLPLGTPAGGLYNGLGVTGNEFDPQLSGTGTHEITYSYTNNNGCTAEATTSILVDECLYIIENEIELFRIYPNPTDKAFVITSEMEQPNAWVKVLDGNGKIIFEESIDQLPLTIQVEDWARGTYFVQVGNQNKTFPTQKIVLQ